MAHAVGSVNTETSGWMPSTEKTRLAGTTTYSANDPGQFVPSPFRFAHIKVRPVRQYSQYPQFMLGLTETYSPTWNPLCAVAQRVHRPDQFVSGSQGELGEELAVVDMQVGAADSGLLDPYADLSWFRIRGRNLPDRETARAIVDNGFHAAP